MLDLLNKRNCPVCGGMMECKKTRHEYENVFSVKWYCSNCGAEYTAKLELTPTGYVAQDREAHIDISDDFSADKFMLGRNNFRRQGW